ETIAVQVLDDDLADAVRSCTRRLNNHGAALLEILEEIVEVGDVQIDVTFERLTRRLREIAAPDLEVNPDTRPLHDAVDSAWLTGGGRNPPDPGIEAKAEDTAIIPGRLPPISDSEDRRPPPVLSGQDPVPPGSVLIKGGQAPRSSVCLRGFRHHLGA